VRVVGALVALLVVGVGAVYGISTTRMSRTHRVAAHAIPVSDDPVVVAQGRRLARIRGCDDCHGENLGGKVLIDHPLLGRVATANLTAGREGGALTAEAFELAVRHGVRPDGDALLVMPSQEFAQLSDEDVGALYSYVRTLPAASAPLPASRIGPLGHALNVAGQLHLTTAHLIQQAAPHTTPPPVGATVEYGRYQASTCMGCHKPDFTGGPLPGSPPGAPPAANLTPDLTEGIGRWTEDEFVTALTTGIRPDGPPINGEFMPIKMTKELTETEKRAIYRYLRTVEAKQAAK
jgi:mono/diheme cytochrome c family protein